MIKNKNCFWSSTLILYSEATTERPKFPGNETWYTCYSEDQTLLQVC